MHLFHSISPFYLFFRGNNVVTKTTNNPTVRIESGKRCAPIQLTGKEKTSKTRLKPPVPNYWFAMKINPTNDTNGNLAEETGSRSKSLCGPAKAVSSTNIYRRCIK
jgi:hypothetical protein